MTRQRDLMSRVAFGADYDGDVWMWTNNPSSVNWTVTVRQKWAGIETRESPQRVTGLELEIFGVIEWGRKPPVRRADGVGEPPQCMARGPGASRSD